jgi:hypothetical protein
MKPLTRFALLVLVASAGCSGGGGGGGGPTSPPPGIAFTPTGSTAANAVVLQQGAESTATRLRVEVRAERFDAALYAVAFDLVFPGDLLGYAGVTEGTFLGGTPTSLQVAESTPGRLVVGLSRLGPAGGSTGSGLLMTLDFSAKGVAGSGSFRFDREVAFDPAGRSISPTSWAGGSVTVVP